MIVQHKPYGLLVKATLKRSTDPHRRADKNISTYIVQSWENCGLFNTYTLDIFKIIIAWAQFLALPALAHKLGMPESTRELKERVCKGFRKKNNNNNAAEEADDGSVRANVNSQEEATINEVTCEVIEDPFTAPFQGERPCWFCAYNTVSCMNMLFIYYLQLHCMSRQLMQKRTEFADFCPSLQH